MSLRPNRSVFGVGGSRRASAQQSAALREPAVAPRPDLRVLEGGGKTLRQERLGRARVVASVAVLGLILFGVVAFHVVLSQGQFELEQMETRAAEEQAQYDKRRLQVAQLESPERITQEATNRLGMVPAEKVTAVAPDAQDISPLAKNFEISGGNPTNDPSRAQSWAKVKPHLSSATK